MIQLDYQRLAAQIQRQLDRVNKRFPDAVPLDKFHESVIDGTVQVFPFGNDSVFVCQLYPDYGDIIAAAGSLKELLEAEPFVCEWYAAKGCKYMLLRGRVGWRKTLLSMGWHSTFIENELRKELSHGSV